MFPAPRLATVAALIATPVVMLSACTSSGSSTLPSSRAPSTSATTNTVSPSSSTTPSTSSSPTTSSSSGSAALVADANRICKAGNRYRAAHPFPYPRFDSSKPTVADLPGVAAYLKKGPDVVGQLLGLDLPLDVATALTQERRNANALIAAAAGSDAQSFARAAKDRASIGQRLYAVSKPSGLDAAKACLTYFRKY